MDPRTDQPDETPAAEPAETPVETPAAAPAVAPEPHTAESLRKLTVPQLKKLCDELRLNRSGRKREEQFIELILAHQAEQQANAAAATPDEPTTDGEPQEASETEHQPADPSAERGDPPAGGDGNGGEDPATLTGGDADGEGTEGGADTQDSGAGNGDAVNGDAANASDAPVEPATAEAATSESIAAGDGETVIDAVDEGEGERDGEGDETGVEIPDGVALVGGLAVTVPRPFAPEGLRLRFGTARLTAAQAATQNGLFLAMRELGLPVRRQTDVYGVLLDLIGNAAGVAE